MTVWNVRIEPVAQEDIRSAVAHYEAEAPEVVPRFREAVRKAVGIVRDYPYMASERRPNRRHRATEVFPYHVWYAVDEETSTVSILRVIHVRRDYETLLP